MDESRLQAIGDALVRVYALVSEVRDRVEAVDAKVTALGQEVQAVRNGVADTSLLVSGTTGDVEALVTETANLSTRVDQLEHAVSNIRIYRAAGPPVA